MSNHCSNVPASKLNAGLTEVKFEFRLKAAKEPKLYETYHGVFVNINYLVKCELKRSFLAKSIQKTQQFVIQYKVNGSGKWLCPPPIFNRFEKYFQPIPKCPTTEVNFSISPETLQKTAKERISIPRFLITGHLDFTECCLTKPFTGHVNTKLLQLTLVVLTESVFVDNRTAHRSGDQINRIAIGPRGNVRLRRGLFQRRNGNSKYSNCRRQHLYEAADTNFHDLSTAVHVSDSHFQEL